MSQGVCGCMFNLVNPAAVMFCFPQSLILLYVPHYGLYLMVNTLSIFMFIPAPSCGMAGRHGTFE